MEPATKRARVDAWVRPRAPLAPSSVLFQCMEIEELDGVDAPDSAFPSGAASLLLYGVTDGDNSVAVHIHGFMPYFWVRAPVDYTPKHAESFRLSLESVMVSGDAEWKRKFAIGSVVRVDLHYRASIMGYTENLRQPFLRVTVSKPRNVATARQACIAGFPLAYREPSDPLFQCQTFESNVEYPLRYMIDKGIAGAAWVELPGFTQRVGRGKMTHCQIEVDAPFDALVAHHYDVRSHIAPLRILSFDIECAGRPGIFPEAEKDPVIQIACYVTRQGENAPFVRVVFTLLRCAHIAHATVLSYETEEELLAAFQLFVVGTDPDILTGYNIVNFDIPYLIDRAAQLKVKTFPYLGRQKAVASKVAESRFSSKAYGTRTSKITNINGRVTLDGMIVAQRDYKLRSYTLNSVSFHFLQESKEDVHHSMITTLQNDSDDTRRRLAVYCLKDALLPQRLMDKLMFLINYIEQARVCGVPIGYLLSRGQQIKVFSQLLRKALQRGYLIPYNKSEQTDEKYTGATVIEPDRGYYDKPITTLDFSSLYPSIMMAHNLCYSTLGATANAADFTHTPNGDDFIKPAVRKGILPEILEELITTRKNVKRMMKVEKDPFRYAVLDGRQLALKISANSVYGFTGATLGKLPCLSISSSVTAFGREMIAQTKAAVQERYRVANGYKHDARVIYGDSVVGSTCLVVRMDGKINTVRIDELGGEWQPYHDNKERVVIHGLEVYSNGAFTAVEQVIRHKKGPKQILQVCTGAGIVECTEDHSLLRPNGECVSPNDVRVGDRLMHTPLDKFIAGIEIGVKDTGITDEDAFDMGLFVAEIPGVYDCITKYSWYNAHKQLKIPHEILMAPLPVLRMFWDGFCTGFNEPAIPVETTSWEKIAGLAIIGQRLGMEISDHPRITKIVPMDYPEDTYVYDLTTADHTFGVAPGTMTVHNTDSVMIQFGNETVAECMVLGAEAAEFVNELFIKPINLEFEKVYFPYLLITKKRYAGLYWTKPDKWDKLDCKGIESTRRDNCLLVKNVIDRVLQMLLVEKDAPGAMAHVKKTIAELYQNRVDLSLLVISKSFAREVYKGKQPHVELVKKMRARDPATAPNLGDRVPYVVIRGDKKMRTYEKVEDPMYVLENNLQIDFEYYLQNQLAKPLTRLFEPILREKVTSLLAGDHTRAIAVVTPVNGMSRFLVKQDKCLGCRCLVPDKRPLCDSCSTKGTSIYLEQLQKQKQIQREFHALQVNCQHCQGSLTNEVICSNRDCMKFYRSKRSQKDAQAMAETMARFEW